jgi:DNA (cytosine-5)-methyltransferase 1
MMTHKILDLFSGLGGFSLGLERTSHFKTIAFCDNDKFSKLILDKHWKGIKIYDDVREITKEKFKEDGIPFPDIITGGFPCQPFSVAGKQKGTSDDRHLWPEMFRIIKAFKPRYVIGENVRGIVNIQDGVVFETVCTDLESEGYEVQPFIIPAAGVGAPHRRERVWIIAHREESMVNPNNHGLEQHNETEKTTSWRGTSATSQSTSSTNVANTVGNDEGREISRGDEETRRIQEEHRTEHSTTRKSSRTSEVRNGDDGYENMENPRRTLRSRGELGAADEDETRKENADQFERSSSTSESNVADTERERLQGGYKRDKGEGRQILSSEQHNGGEIWSEARRFSGVSGQKEGSQNWWLVEPNVGRVAHGVSGRVHRLKGLGNSIVPQIAEEIGYALIRAEHEVE